MHTFTGCLRESFDAACRTVGWLALAALAVVFVAGTYLAGEALHVAARTVAG